MRINTLHEHSVTDFGCLPELVGEDTGPKWY